MGDAMYVPLPLPDAGVPLTGEAEEAAYQITKLVRAGWLVPVRATDEYRLVAKRYGGTRLKRWPKPKHDKAVQALARLEKDIAERPLCGYTDPFLEARQVTEWGPV